jgi:hypothetical protein
VSSAKSPRLTAFEYAASSSDVQKPHSLLFIGGLSDGLCTVPYVNDIVTALEPTGWSVFSVLLSSSYTGWGLGSLDKDVEELAACVDYVRWYKFAQSADGAEPGMLVLMGHSTGSQDVLHYLHSPNPLPLNQKFNSGLQHITRPPVDGGILQAPASDKEALLSWHRHSKIYSQAVEFAKENTYTKDKEDVLIPLSMTAALDFPGDVAISSRRFLSLANPSKPIEPPLDDDLFSSDLEDHHLEQTFGKIASRGLLKKTLLVLPSGADQYVPAWVDKEKELARWEQATKLGVNRPIWDAAHSSIVPGATHSPSGDRQAEPRRNLVSRVTGYLKGLESLTLPSS